MSKTENVCFSKEQKDMLEYMMRDKISECVENIMNSDSEGDDFEGDRDSFTGLFEKVFTFKSLKEIKNDFKGDIRERGKKVKRVKDPNMPKKNKTPYFIWLWNQDIDIGMSKIKNDFPDLTHKQALSKAGEIWNSMTYTLKNTFIEKSKEDKVRYENDMLEYKNSTQYTEEETEVVEPKKKGKQKKSVTKEEVSSADTEEEETEVVEPKKKGKQKKSVTKEEASSADTEEEAHEATKEL